MPMPLRFTIRDLLWLTALVAMGVGWWIDTPITALGEKHFRCPARGRHDKLNHFAVAWGTAMTDEEIQQIAKETGTPEAVIRTALPLIPVEKHSEWIGLLKLDNAASKMAHSYGWTVGHAISYIRGTSPTSPILKRSPLRFRFTIRDLLWLTLVVALATGWWMTTGRESAAPQQ